MQRRAIPIVFAVLLGASAALGVRADDALDNLRAEFQRAYASATSPGAADAPSSDSKSLRDYVLYPYLQQARIRRAFNDLQADRATVDAQAAAFLNAHEGEAVSAELRRAWYLNLAGRLEWETLLANYRDVNDAVIQCHALTARLTLQRLDNLRAAAISAWLNAPESRIACDPIFTWLRSEGALTDALVEKRARLALAAGNASFARQMIALLPAEGFEPLKNWAALVKNPLAAIDNAIASPSKPIELAALLDGWTRLVRTDPVAGMTRYKSLVAARALPAETASRMALELAQVLAWNRRSEALDYFSRVRGGELDERGAEWSARAALWAGNWKRTATIIAAMPPALRQQTKWRYWSARVAELRGNTSAARTQYAGLLNDDNYYAALAAARLEKPYTPKPKPLTVTEAQTQTIAAQPAFIRAHELMSMQLLELRNFAYDEWRRGYTSLDSAGRMQSIALAANWGWYDQAILTAAQQNFFDDYALLYPHPFDTDVRGAAEIVKLPEALIYATLRQESLYRSDAISGANARGLMQLIDDTAKRTTRHWPEIAKALRNRRDLFDPTTNIYVGAARLRDLADRYEGKIQLALAAYNAGPVTISRWLPKQPIDIDIWIENIPYNETRVYVQRILWHSVVFGWLATNKEQSTMHWLAEVQSKSGASGAGSAEGSK